MVEYVNVPVPSDLVVEVMRFIATLTEPQEATAPVTASVSDAEGAPTADKWSRSELEVINAHRGSMPSVELFAQVLTHLAAISPTPQPRDDIAAALGEDGVRMSNKFGAVTRFINNRIPSRHDSWPFSYDDNGWSLDPETAKLWTAITSGD